MSVSCGALSQGKLVASDELHTPRTFLDEALDDPIAIVGQPAAKTIEEWRTADGNRVTKVRTFWGSYCVSAPLNPPAFMRNDIGTNVSLPTTCPK